MIANLSTRQRATLLLIASWVAGGTLRMPVGGAFAMRPSRKDPSKRVEGNYTVTYSGFQEVR